MSGERVADRIARGMGVAARRIGTAHDAYRPRGADRPLTGSNRFLRLSAAFDAADPRFSRAQDYGRAVWYGVFDSAYTRPGDFLRAVADGRTWFVASQEPLLPVVCVRTNAVLDLARPAGPGLPGLDGYGGVQRGAIASVGRGWPASVLGHGAGGEATLPGDTRLGGVDVLLPPSCPEVRADDLLRDERGRGFVVAWAERSAMGWRLFARQEAA